MRTKIKGFDKLTKELNKMNKKAKKYDGTHDLKLPFTEDEWEKMDEKQKQIHINKAQDEFINKAIDDILK